MDIWVEGLERGEADQRPAPMTVMITNTFHHLIGGTEGMNGGVPGWCDSGWEYMVGVEDNGMTD